MTSPMFFFRSILAKLRKSNPSRLNPLVEELAEAKTDGQRAKWLLTVPLDIMMSRKSQIYEVLRAANYIPGLKYQACVIAMLSERREVGIHRPSTLEALERASRPLLIDAIVSGKSRR